MRKLNKDYSIYTVLYHLLQDRELKVFSYRMQRQTLEEVGRALGVTRERVRQIEAKALKKISKATTIYVDVDSMTEESRKTYLSQPLNRLYLVGVGEITIEKLRSHGINSGQNILDQGLKGLEKVLTKHRAKIVWDSLQHRLNNKHYMRWAEMATEGGK